MIVILQVIFTRLKALQKNK